MPIIESEMWVCLRVYFVPDSRGYFRGYFVPCLNAIYRHERDVMFWGSFEGYKERFMHGVICRHGSE